MFRKKPKTVGVQAKKKIQKYSAPLGCNSFALCHHNNKRLKCYKVRPPDAATLRKSIYEFPDKYEQDCKISSYLRFSNVKRRRPKRQPQANNPNTKLKPHGFNVNYSIFNSNGKVIPVCKKLFMHLTRVKATRFHNIAKKVRKIKA